MVYGVAKPNNEFDICRNEIVPKSQISATGGHFLLLTTIIWNGCIDADFTSATVFIFQHWKTFFSERKEERKMSKTISVGDSNRFLSIVLFACLLGL